MAFDKKDFYARTMHTPDTPQRAALREALREVSRALIPLHRRLIDATRDDYAFGYNAQTGEYGNLVKQGVIDPAKVVRTALQDAASVAGLLITTEAMVAEKPKKKAPAMPQGGGMGDMDF